MVTLNEAHPFNQRLHLWAKRIRRRLLLRELVTGLTVGTSVALLGIAVAWWLGIATPARALPSLALLFGAALGILRYRRYRWTDQEVALFLDARLETHEVLSSALEAAAHPEEPLGAAVLLSASETLSRAPATTAKLTVLRRKHFGTALMSAAAAVLLYLPSPPAALRGAQPASAAAPGKLSGLSAVEALASAPARTQEQAARLRQMAQDARRLREAWERGMDRRDALSKVATLRDSIRAERELFGDSASNAGREAAVEAMQGDRSLRRAASALGNGDLTGFDDAMAQLARDLEHRDRIHAKEILQQSAQAAAARGARTLAERMGAEAERMDNQGSGLDTLRELADALSSSLDPETRRLLEKQGNPGSPDAQRKLAQALAKALDGMSKQQRAALAQRLSERLKEDSGEFSEMTREQLESMAEHLSSDSGQRELQKALSDLAQSTPGEAAGPDGALGEAERGLGETQRQLGMLPIPTPNGPPGQGPGPTPQAEGNHPGPGQSGAEAATGQHRAPSSDENAPPAGLDARPLQAKVSPRILPGLPMRTASLGRAHSRPGERALLPSQAALSAARPEALSGIERPEIPEEYRDHVGRYFQP